MNEHEAANRHAKARKIASVVVTVAAGLKGKPSEVARWMRPDERKIVYQIADKIDRANGGNGVHPSRDNKTWNEVVESLEDAEVMAASLAGTGPIGPLTLRRVGL